MPSASNATEPTAREGGGGGASSQKTCRPPAHTEPLAEGGFVAKRLALLLIVGLVVPAVASAATVKVRVEGKTRTLFGAIEQASILGELYYHVTQTSFGPYVDQVGRYGGSASSGWVFKVDNASPPVGADKVQLKDGDVV